MKISPTLESLKLQVMDALMITVKTRRIPIPIPVDAHFLEAGHDFNLHAKFTFIEQLRRRDLTNMEKTRLLKEREHFWIKKVQIVLLKN